MRNKALAVLAAATVLAGSGCTQPGDARPGYGPGEIQRELRARQRRLMSRRTS